MKNQYYGDINDYIKYGILRALSDGGRNRIAVCWMLTPNDGRSDGRFTEYLKKAPEWRAYDPPLFDVLKDTHSMRNVSEVERNRLIPEASYYTALLFDGIDPRKEYFEGFRTMAQDQELLFFDPDNGLETKSQAKGRKGSSKYLFWDEVKDSYSKGHSLLVFQYFPRRNHDLFIREVGEVLMSKTGAAAIGFFQTPRVVYFLVLQEDHANRLQALSSQVGSQWGPKAITRSGLIPSGRDWS